MANLSWISSNPDYINQMIRNTQVTLSNNYNDLDNIPIIKITSTTNNPQKIWELKEGLYMIDGVVQVDNSTSYEVSNLLISMTARLENGKYILSAFIPYLRGLFEYILKTNSTEYEQHQKIVLMIKNDTLALDNETIYTPIEDYHPATKKYVDDKANEIVAELDRMGVNKENLESLNKENRIRDIKLQALLSETSDRNITIEENVRYFDMPLSIDNGIVTINEIVGETLVNVCDQEETVAITKSYTVENENHIPLQGEYDGSCRPVLHGNTLVNHNADWDGKVQTGVETSASGIEDVQVEGIKGQEVSVVVEGNTVLNHALGKTSAVVSNIESNLFNGNTYHGSISSLPVKPLTTYTVIATCLLNEATSENIGQFNYCFFSNETTHYNHESLAYYSGIQVGEQVTTTIVTDENCKYIGVYDTNSNFIMRDILILEGDHTTNPKYVNSNEGNYVDLTVANDMSSVVEIEGRTMYYNNDTGEYLYEFVENSNLSLKSSYECEVTEDGKYKVDVKVTGKNLCPNGSQAVNVNIDTGSEYSGASNCRMSDYVHFDSSVSYSYKVRINKGTPLTSGITVRYYDINKKYIGGGEVGNNIPLNAHYIRCRYLNEGLTESDVVDFMMTKAYHVNWVEYFESTKTFYLNSPLLEGDKIVTKNGKVYHYHKMGRVVLDGSRTWWGSSNINGITFMATTSLFNLGTSDRKMLCDSLRVNQGFNQDSLTDYNEILAHKSSAYSNACYISTQLSQSDFINWLKSNPITVVYELDTPYYELIDEYNNTILNIPKNVAHLTHTSAVPVNNTTFTNYKDELNVLEANTQYRVMFDCDTANIPFTVTLGGTSQEVTSKNGTHSLLITTPSELVDKNLVIDGIGRCGIDNIRIFKGDVEYDYVKGLWSGYEERKLENLGKDTLVPGTAAWVKVNKEKLIVHNKYTIIVGLDEILLDTQIDIITRYNYNGLSNKILGVLVPSGDSRGVLSFTADSPNVYLGCWPMTSQGKNAKVIILEGDWTDNPPTYEEVMANEGKYAVKVKLDTNATIFGKGGRL